MTAQILIGRPHPNDDGINTTHCIYLSENSRAALLLYNHDLQYGSRGGKPIVWTPSLDNIIEDAILMIAVHVIQDEEIIQILESFGVANTKKLETYKDLLEEQRNALYQKCRDKMEIPKLIISVFYSSSLRMNLSVLKLYKMDIEVCRPIYTQLYSRWSHEVTTIGELEYTDSRF